MEEVTSYLKDFYKTHFEQVRPLLLPEEHELHLSEVYTKSHIQCRSDNGHFDDDINGDSLTDIFKEYRKSSSQGKHESEETMTQTKIRKVHLEGPAGTGKSVYCKKLAYAWASGRLDRYSMVFLLELRHIKGNLIDAIFDQILCNDINISKEELQKYIVQHQDQIIFILDGLNGLSSHPQVRSISDLLKSTNEQLLQGCHVLVTSRPSPQAQDLEQCDILCKLMGFTWECSQDYVMKFFKDSEDTARQLLMKVEESRKIRELSLNPLSIMLICSIWRYDGILEFSEKAELYTAMVHCIVKCFCCKKGWEFDLKNPPIEQVLRSLGKLAWDGLRKGKLQFEIDFIKKEFPSPQDMLSVGLLTTDFSPCLARKCGHSEFLHETFQEYMAARFLWCEVAAAARDEAYSLQHELKHMMTSPALYEVHKFFKGIFKRNSVESKERLAVLFEAHLDAIKDSENIEV